MRMEDYDYRIERCSIVDAGAPMKKKVRQLASEGWEHYQTRASVKGKPCAYLYFRRPKRLKILD